MSDFLLSHYVWIKALHIIAMVAWIAGMLYLPRLFVYHADAPAGSDKSETFKVMERRLSKAIMLPAMIATFLFGFLMIAANPDLMSQGWIHVKLFCVFLLAGLHGAFMKWRKDFANDRNTRAAHFYRFWNEAPTVLMIIIIVMAVVKPF